MKACNILRICKLLKTKFALEKFQSGEIGLLEQRKKNATYYLFVFLPMNVVFCNTWHIMIDH